MKTISHHLSMMIRGERFQKRTTWGIQSYLPMTIKAIFCLKRMLPEAQFIISMTQTAIKHIKLMQMVIKHNMNMTALAG